MDMKHLDYLRKEYERLVSSITRDNIKEHKSIVREIDRNIDKQRCFLNRYDQ